MSTTLQCHATAGCALSRLSVLAIILVVLSATSTDASNRRRHTHQLHHQHHHRHTATSRHHGEAFNSANSIDVGPLKQFMNVKPTALRAKIGSFQVTDEISSTAATADQQPTKNKASPSGSLVAIMADAPVDADGTILLTQIVANSKARKLKVDNAAHPVRSREAPLVALTETDSEILHSAEALAAAEAAGIINDGPNRLSVSDVKQFPYSAIGEFNYGVRASVVCYSCTDSSPYALLSA